MLIRKSRSACNMHIATQILSFGYTWIKTYMKTHMETHMETCKYTFKLASKHTCKHLPNMSRFQGRTRYIAFIYACKHAFNTYKHN